MLVFVYLIFLSSVISACHIHTLMLPLPLYTVFGHKPLVFILSKLSHKSTKSTVKPQTDKG